MYFSKKLKRVMAFVLTAVMTVTLCQVTPGNVVKAAEDPTTKIWNFKGGEEGAFAEKIEKKTGTFDGIEIDATNGKCSSRYDQAGKLDTQINANTVLKVPVPANSVYTLTINARAACDWTVDDNPVANTGDKSKNPFIDFVYEGKTGSDPFITLACTANGYMKEIKIASMPDPNGPKEKTWNFKGGEEGAYAEKIEKKTGAFDGIEIDATNGKCSSRYDQAGKLDTQINANTVLKVPVPSNSVYTLTINARAACDWTVDDNPVANTGDKSKNPFIDFVYEGKTGSDPFITLVCTANGYMKEIKVSSKPAPTVAAESFTFIMDEKAENGEVAQGDYKYGDSVLGVYGMGADTKLVPGGAGATIDGVEHKTYKAGNRHATANDIPSIPKQGDGSMIVFTPAADGMFTVYFNSTSFIRVWDFNTADGTRNGYVDAEIGLSSYSIKAEAGHTYVASTTGKTNNMFYAGARYIVDENIAVPVTVTNNDAVLSDALTINLTDADLGGKAVALKVGENNVKLKKDHTYTLSTNDGGVSALTEAGASTIKATADGAKVVLNNVPDVTISGKIVGTDVANVTSLTFVNMATKTDNVATVNADGTYSVSVKPGEYNTSIVTTNGGKTYDRASAKAGVDNVNDVYVEYIDAAAKRTYKYDVIPELPIVGNVKIETGKTHVVARATKNGEELVPSTITIPVSVPAKVKVSYYYEAGFNMNDKAVAIVEGDTSWHTTSATDSTTIETDKDVVLTFAEDKSSYITSIEVIPTNVQFKSEINVPEDYATLNAASDAIQCMTDRPEGEAGRVTINLHTDIFEQTVMNADRVTLKGNDHTISWYYGVGTNYYSIDPATGLYNKRLAMDRYSSTEGNGSLWGGVFIVRGDNFIAENTTFKNTYNYELTEAEKTDIAGSNLTVDRLAEGADVSDYKYKERSNAFYIEANNIECYNCKILSSQDTLGRNGSANNGYHTYFKNCVIGGNTDYICGEFAAIFDNCELQWKTFKNDESNNKKVGYIVAPKTSPYVFRNCKITTTGVEGSQEVLGLYGRTWGANSNCSFINTETNGLIAADGWGEMSKGEYDSAVFNEYNNTNKGVAFTGGKATSTSQEAVASYIDTKDTTAVTTVLADWKPVHYVVTVEDLSMFKDVDQSPAKWYYAGIKYVYEENIMSGYKDANGNLTGMFGPNDALTRAQFATIIYRMAGEPSVKYAGTFKDVKEGKFYAAAAEWCASKGVVTGRGGTNVFDPDAKITRQEIATMLYRFAAASGKNMNASADLLAFADANEVSSFAVAPIEWCVGTGIMTGKQLPEGAKLDPKGTASRAEAATMIARYMK